MRTNYLLSLLSLFSYSENQLKDSQVKIVLTLKGTPVPSNSLSFYTYFYFSHAIPISPDIRLNQLSANVYNYIPPLVNTATCQVRFLLSIFTRLLDTRYAVGDAIRPSKQLSYNLSQLILDLKERQHLSSTQPPNHTMFTQ